MSLRDKLEEKGITKTVNVCKTTNDELTLLGSLQEINKIFAMLSTNKPDKEIFDYHIKICESLVLSQSSRRSIEYTNSKNTQVLQDTKIAGPCQHINYIELQTFAGTTILCHDCGENIGTAT